MRSQRRFGGGQRALECRRRSRPVAGRQQRHPEIEVDEGVARPIGHLQLEQTEIPLELGRRHLDVALVEDRDVARRDATAGPPDRGRDLLVDAAREAHAVALPEESAIPVRDDR